MTLKKAKLYRRLLRLTFAIIGFVIPIVTMCIKFDLTKETTKNRITTVGIFIIMLIISLLWKFKTRLYNWINSWEYSLLKYILIGFSRVYIFVLILSVALLVRANVIENMEALKQGIETGLDNIIFCLYTTCVCQCIAYLAVYPFEQRFDYIVQRIIRKNERIEDYNEAIDRRSN